MIDQVLEVTRKEVNDYIDDKLGGAAGENRVVLTSFVDDSGNIAIPDDSVGLIMLNIEEEKQLKMTGLVQKQQSENTSSFINPAVNLNLHIMFASHFNQYDESLKHISYIISFFQQKPYFDSDNTPAIATLETSRLLFDWTTINLEQLHYIWSVLGTRYLPSVIYKVRMLSIQSQESTKDVANIKEIIVNANKKDVND